MRLQNHHWNSDQPKYWNLQLLILLMSLSKNKSFLKEYAKSSYMNKINPEYEGIAKRYYNEKREHDKIHHIKDKLNKEVAYIERMERSLQNNLQKKKRQLEFTRQVNNRIINDYRRRQWIHEYKAKTIENKQQHAQLLKSQSQRKLQEAKDCLTQSKRSVASISRSENAKMKELKSLNRAKEWDSNRSRVSSIQKFKKDVKENTNKFYQTRNSSAMSSYHKRIKSYQNFQAYDSQKIKQLEQKKLALTKRYQQEKEKCDEITKQLERLKEQSKLQTSLVRSRLKSRSSGALSARSDHSLKRGRTTRDLMAGYH